MVKKPILISAACISALLLSTAQASCGSAVCSINTNIETQGRLAMGETRVGLRFEFIDQDQPRAGRRAVSVGEFIWSALDAIAGSKARASPIEVGCRVSPAREIVCSCSASSRIP